MKIVKIPNHIKMQLCAVFYVDSLPKVCYLAGSKVFFKREPLAGLLYFCLYSKEVFEYFLSFLFT